MHHDASGGVAQQQVVGAQPLLCERAAVDLDGQRLQVRVRVRVRVRVIRVRVRVRVRDG